MYTHVPVFLDALQDSLKMRRRWGGYEYNRVVQTTTKGGGYKTAEEFQKFVNDVKMHGIKVPLTGWMIGKPPNFAVELLGGHHRALVAALRGEDTVPFQPLPFDAMKECDIGPVRAAYNKVRQTENLQADQCYNYFPGMSPIRLGQDRLLMIYREIIDCPGNTLADLGCNDGYFGVELSRKDFNVTFVDRSVAYLEVVSAKIGMINTKATHPSSAAIYSGDIIKFLSRKFTTFDVVLYLDVFYHTALDKGKEAAYAELHKIIEHTKDRLIFAPGRWDRLESKGIKQADLFRFIAMNNRIRRIKYLGRDSDKGYGRDIFSIHKR
jgi:hypothetical protein